MLAVVAAALTGCEADPPPPAEPKIAAGLCVAEESKDQGNAVPDFTSIVDCDRPHVYEVFAVADLPRKALTGSTREERAANRDDLALPRELSKDSAQRTAFEDFADEGCLSSFLKVTGYDDVVLRGKKAADAEVLPALLGVTLGYSVMPEKQWLDGQQQMLCTARFDDPESGDRLPRASGNEALLVGGARTALFPIDLRPCRSYDKKREKLSVRACDEQHVSETLFFFEADSVFGKKFIERLRAKPTAKKFDRFDDVCTEALPVLLGPDYDRKKLRGFGSSARRWTKTGTPVRCDVGPKRFKKRDLRAGSLVGTGADKVRLVAVD